MQTVEPLAIRQAAAPAPTKQAAPADGPASFRASMDKAQQRIDAAQESETAQLGEETTIPQGELVLEEQAQAIVPLGEAIEGLLPLETDKQPGEDVPAQNEAEMAVLATLLVQGGNEIEQNQILADLPEDVVQELPESAPHHSPSMETEGLHDVGIAAQLQAPVSQEGIRELPRMEEPVAEAATTLFEQENSLSGEPLRQPAAMTAGAAEDFREQDMDKTQANTEPTAFMQVAQGEYPVLALSSPDGVALPEPKAQQALTESLFEQVQSAISAGKQELFVQLKPESLGGLVIHLSMTEEGLKAQVRTSSENIQQLITGQLAQLEEALRARDIPVVQMDVIYDQTANSAFLGQQQRQAWQQSGTWGRGSFTLQAEETAGLYEAAFTAPAEEMGEAGVVYSA